MSSINGAYIVQDGLVLFLDAANPNSYSSGITFSNLYSNSSATLVNNLLWDNGNNGTFVFDGNDDYINYSNTFNNLNNLTVNFWVLNPNGNVIITKGYRYWEIRLNPVLFAGYVGINNVTNYWADISAVSIPHGASLSNWNNFTYAYDYTNSIIKFYTNGVLKGTRNSFDGYTMSATYSTTYNLRIGNRVEDNTASYLGQASLFQIYNRTLSDAEVLQNYIALRSRFNISNKDNYYYYYLSRISGNNGIIENTNNLLNKTTNLINQNILSTATFLLVPVGYTTSIVNSISPNLIAANNMTFSRGSNATRVNSSGTIELLGNNIPQFDYGYTYSYPSLLLEPQRTNSILYSQDFTQSYWTSVISVILFGGSGSAPIATGNYATAPDGTLTATRFQFNLNGGTSINDLSVVNKLGIITATNGISSIYMKSNTSLTYSVFLSAGNATSLIPQLISTTWQRYTFLATNCDGIQFGLRGTIGTTDTADILAWGAQVEIVPVNGLQSFATSYIPTTNATVTRNASSITKSDIYTNNIISASGGTWFLDVSNNLSVAADNGLAQQLGLGNNFIGASADNIWIGGGASPGRLKIWTQVAGALATRYTTLTNNAKIVVNWDGLTMSTFVNGTKVATTSFTPVNMDTLRTYTVGMPYYINQMALWNTPLNDTQCRLLST